MELGLAGKVALVTGSSRGIGRGIALALADEGCNVLVTGRDEAALAEVASSIRSKGVKAVAAALDLCAAGTAGARGGTPLGRGGGGGVRGQKAPASGAGGRLLPPARPRCGGVSPRNSSPC